MRKAVSADDPKKDEKEQAAAFRKAARELGCDDDEERFQGVLKKLGRQKGEARAVVHASDCAVHDAPAYEAGPCNCGAIKAER
jgi:hypothetical protein